LNPHWSQWVPKQTSGDLINPASFSPRPPPNLTPRPPTSPRKAETPGIHSWRNTEPTNDAMATTTYNDMTAMMNNGDRHVIMNRGLSPRRAAPPRMPGRTMTHYGSFGNREQPNPYIGGLDLHASNYQANRGFNQGITSYTSREGRPMHRHMRKCSKGEDYRHDQSTFYNTTPMATGYFIIHPDWVSERLSMRRSKSLLSF